MKDPTPRALKRQQKGAYRGVQEMIATLRHWPEAWKGLERMINAEVLGGYYGSHGAAELVQRAIARRRAVDADDWRARESLIRNWSETPEQTLSLLQDIVKDFQQ